MSEHQNDINNISGDVSMISSTKFLIKRPVGEKAQMLIKKWDKNWVQWMNESSRLVDLTYVGLTLQGNSAGRSAGRPRLGPQRLLHPSVLVLRHWLPRDIRLVRGVRILHLPPVDEGQHSGHCGALARQAIALHQALWVFFLPISHFSIWR